MAELFAALGLEPTASNDRIRAAITEQRRAWRRRTTSPELGVRQEAERRMKLLDDAEHTLLDPDRRAEYLAEPAQSADAGDGRWIVKALEHLEHGRHSAAVFNAQQAIDDDPANPYAYSVLAEAAAAGGDSWAASEAIGAALRLEPDDSRLHAQQAAILADAGEAPRAVGALQTAVSLNPDEPVYHERLIDLLVSTGDVDAAIDAAERAYQRHPDDGDIRTALADAIAERAVLAHHELPDGRLVITTPEQADYVESLCDRGLSVQAPDPGVNAELTQQRTYARKAKRRRFSFSAFRQHWKWPVGMGIFAVASLFCTSGLAGSSAFGYAALLTVTFGVVSAATLWVTCYERQYVRNAALVERVVPRRSGALPEPAPPAGSRALRRDVRPYAAVPTRASAVPPPRRVRE